MTMSVPGSKVELRTGELREAARGDLVHDPVHEVLDLRLEKELGGLTGSSQ